MSVTTRTIHPAVANDEIWPGPKGYPWAESGIRLFAREGILRHVAPGRLMCTWTTGGFTEPIDGNFTMVSYSEDDGQTWSAPDVLFRHSHRGLFTTELFIPRPREIHAFLQTYTLGTWMTQIQSYRATSVDGGITWSGPHSIPGGLHNVWVNQGIVHSSGRWIIPVSWAEQMGEEWCEPSTGRSPAEPRVGASVPPMVELPWGSDTRLIYETANAWAHRNHRYVVGAMISDDGGATFQLRGYLWRDDPRHFFEPKVVELATGAVVLLARESHDGWLWRSESNDRGETWAPLERTEIPNPSTKVKLMRARDGRIFLVHNPVRTDAAQWDGKTWGHRSPLSLWVSDDEMRTWRVQVDLVTDTAKNLNYPDGYIDEEARELRFAWEDAYRVFVMRVPIDIS